MTKKILQYSILMLLGLCFVTAVIRTVFNFSKIYTDKHTYLFETKQNVEENFFGSRIKLVALLSKGNRGNIYLLNPDPLTFYYLRYTLYPLKIFRSNDKSYGRPIIPTTYDYYVFYKISDVNKYSLTLKKNYDLISNENTLPLIYKEK